MEVALPEQDSSEPSQQIFTQLGNNTSGVMVISRKCGDDRRCMSFQNLISVLFKVQTAGAVLDASVISSSRRHSGFLCTDKNIRELVDEVATDQVHRVLTEKTQISWTGRAMEVLRGQG